MHSIIIPIYPTNFQETLRKLHILNEIDDKNITVSLISLQAFFTSPETSNDFVSTLIKEAKAKYPISQIWMDEIFGKYNIFPAICPEKNDHYAYFDIVKIFIPYIRGNILTDGNVIYLGGDFDKSYIEKLLEYKFTDSKVQVYILEPKTNIIDEINKNFKDKNYSHITWEKFKNNTTTLPGDTSVVIYNSAHFIKLLSDTAAEINESVLSSIIMMERCVEFTNYMDAIISLCYNYKLIPAPVLTPITQEKEEVSETILEETDRKMSNKTKYSKKRMRKEK